MTNEELLKKVEALPPEEQKALWHKLGAALHGGAQTQDSGGNIPPPPPPPTKTPPQPGG